jgi:hypothetical protein
MNLQQITSTLTQEEIVTLEKFGIQSVDKKEYNLDSFNEYFTTKSLDRYGRAVSKLYTPNLRYFERFNEQSLKIQYIVKEVYRNSLCKQMNLEQCDQSLMSENFEKIFNFLAPNADKFVLSNNSNNCNSNEAGSLTVAGIGAVTIMFIGSMYSFLLQDRKSFENTLIVGGIIFPLIVLLYGLRAGK